MASDLSHLIVSGHRPWKDLFSKHSFFTSDFKYYIMVISACTDKESHNLWSGFVESKVRVLVQNLERHPSIALARPFNKGYERTHRCKSETELDEIGKGTVKYVVQDTAQPDVEAKVQGEGEADLKVNGDNVPKDESSLDVYTATHYIGVELANSKSIQPSVTVLTSGPYLAADAKQLDLSYQVKEFKDLCFGWDKYTKGELKGHCILGVEHLRRYGRPLPRPLWFSPDKSSFTLPDDVFEPGEVRPKRPLKKKPGAAAGAAAPSPAPAPVPGAPVGSRKRPANEVCSNRARSKSQARAFAGESSRLTRKITARPRSETSADVGFRRSCWVRRAPYVRSRLRTRVPSITEVSSTAQESNRGHGGPREFTTIPCGNLERLRHGVTLLTSKSGAWLTASNITSPIS